MSEGTPGSAAAGAPEWAAPPWLATGGAEICAAPVQTVQQNAPRHIRRETNSRLSMGCSPDGRLSEWCHNCPATRPVRPQSIRKTFARQSIATPPCSAERYLYKRVLQIPICPVVRRGAHSGHAEAAASDLPMIVTTRLGVRCIIAATPRIVSWSAVLVDYYQ
jgi:hypothetical protein